MTLGKRVKELRLAKQLTQRELGKQVGLSFTYISKLEHDRLEHTPSIKALAALAAALGVDELELMELANKVPLVFDKVVRDKDAMRFFRRANELIKDAAGWRELLAYLERNSG